MDFGKKYCTECNWNDNFWWSSRTCSLFFFTGFTQLIKIKYSSPCSFIREVYHVSPIILTATLKTFGRDIIRCCTECNGRTATFGGSNIFILFLGLTGSTSVPDTETFHREGKQKKTPTLCRWVGNSRKRPANTHTHTHTHTPFHPPKHTHTHTHTEKERERERRVLVQCSCGPSPRHRRPPHPHGPRASDGRDEPTLWALARRQPRNR